MVHIQHKVKAFIKLGSFLKEYCEYSKKPIDLVGINGSNLAQFHEKVTLATHKNGWFSQENINFSLLQWSELLTENNLDEWLGNYNLAANNYKTVAIIMAGNIPLVGFHDFLSVILTGNSALIKQSSNDDVLLPFLADYLIQSDPSFKDNILFTEGKLENYDAVIATGSNNTARYFEHYLGKKPNIIRKNRNSIAVLTGNESTDELHALGEDIFQYYGLGCRSVSKIFVPVGYNFDTFFKAIYSYHPIIHRNKYANNYDYNKAVYLMSEFKIFDNEFLILKEDEGYASPIATLFYEFYSDKTALLEKLKQDEEKLQCVVSDWPEMKTVAFGSTQKPSLADYADGLDTVDFLLKT
ncbi:acyl-CoA reductase [Kriegella aquimaris]|uniref:Acyl-CoA reductase (LuxC) n=1 Tax=Kriegella aquimaris TaxID=192904 RepID=A0A1G9J1V3_9FLAO|nr:acyl-CoA reductase [Kriegella aquimaris]SDL31256.1 Acyl-CoA reductase (LuxC) [Kriegella aquimaris]